MNVCAVHSIKQVTHGQQHTTLDQIVWLPHEPESDENQAVGVMQECVLADRLVTFVTGYSTCRHCGGVYKEELK